jgi:hypothetical protein
MPSFLKDDSPSMTRHMTPTPRNLWRNVQAKQQQQDEQVGRRRRV